MKILITTERIHPNKGGISVVLDLLGKAFTERGDQVHVLMTDIPEGCDYPYGPVTSIREEPRKALELVRTADVVLQNNVSLKTLLPILALGRRPAVVLHSWLSFATRGHALRSNLKRAVLRQCAVGSPNEDVYESAGLRGRLVPNPVDRTLFTADGAPSERQGALFVGRLIADKGIRELLQAHASLTDEERRQLPLTVVGGANEPEFEALLKATAAPEVTFVGPKGAEEIAELMRQHTLLAAPSTGSENFPLVILEALASGTTPVGTDHSGIIRGMGDFGTVVHRGPQLVAELKTALSAHIAAGCPVLDPNAPDLARHLERYSMTSMLRAYDALFAETH